MLSGLDFSDLMDPDSAGHVAGDVVDEASKNLEVLAGKAESLDRSGLSDKFRRAKQQLLRKLRLNLGIKSAVLGPACVFSVYADPSWLETARPALALLAFHLGTEAAKKLEDDISETLERRRHAHAVGHSTTVQPRVREEITPEQARKNLAKILWFAALEVGATAIIAVEGRPTKEILDTYAAYFASMTFINYGISRGIVEIHQTGDVLAKNANRFIAASGKFMHKTAQGFYRHNRILAVIGASFSVGRAFAHVFERDNETTELIAHKVGEICGPVMESITKGGEWLGVGMVVGGTGLLLHKTCYEPVAKELKSFKNMSARQAMQTLSVALPLYVPGLGPHSVSGARGSTSAYHGAPPAALALQII